MAGRKPEALRRHEIEKGIVRARHRLVHLGNDGLILMRAGDREHVRMARANALGLDAEAAGHDDAAILGERLADRLERLFLGAVEEAAGVHHDRVGVLVARRQLVAFGAKPGDDALGIDERLGAAQADEADLRWGRRHAHVYRGEQTGRRQR